MKKVIIILIVLMACFSKTQAQVFIDSVKVFDGTYPIIDSVYLKFVHHGAALQSITRTPFNDACGTTYIYVTFKGCTTTSSSKMDTMLTIGYGTKQVYLRVKWDTSSTCAIPITPVYTDSILWRCYPTGIYQQLNRKITIYPNPAQSIVTLEMSNPIELLSLGLYDLQGKEVRVFRKEAKQLSMIGLPKGLYFLRITSEQGTFIEKLVLE